MKKYEVMYILRANLDQEAIKAEVEAAKNIFVNNGSNVLECKEWGLRELAYEIKDFKTGYYYVITCSASNDNAIKEFDRLALISNDIVRHLITKLEK